MIRVRNLTNSPYDLLTATGFVHLPAMGEVVADFTEPYMDLLRAGLGVEVMGEVEPVVAPVVAPKGKRK